MATSNLFLTKEATYSAELPVRENGDDCDQDDMDMARMGKKQEFERNFSWISGVAFTSCTMDESIAFSLLIFNTDLCFYALDMSQLPFLLVVVLTSTLRNLSPSITSKCW